MADSSLRFNGPALAEFAPLVIAGQWLTVTVQEPDLPKLELYQKGFKGPTVQILLWQLTRNSSGWEIRGHMEKAAGGQSFRGYYSPDTGSGWLDSSGC